ncbi:amidohydrolase family protein [Microbulbifer taiwanensis]|uniref:Amidohydrolase family protein n=2 Tax=Microbulbifer taiwanensis TaxID=986746 RepID=A0ABW1YQP5_9GAMM|nr:amidohydrolase family protein [Microbulbifer taiwanensis]
MKTVWLVCLAALLVACGRPEAPRSGSGDSGPTANGAALSPAEPRPAAPEQEPLSVPGVERLVDLRGGRSAADYVQAVEKFMRDNPELQVIVGKGWDATAFGAVPPHKAQLDQVSDFVPIVLISRDHQSVWTNSEGLAAAGINSDTPDPEGGVIEKDENGLAIGVLRGQGAVKLLEKTISPSGGGQLQTDDARHDQPDAR